MLSRIDDGFSPDPKNAIAVIGQTDKREVVGRGFLVSIAHIEGIWLRREYRNGTLMERIVRELEVQARMCGLSQALAFGKDEQMADYIRRLKYTQLPLTVWSKELCHKP